MCEYVDFNWDHLPSAQYPLSGQAGVLLGLVSMVTKVQTSLGQEGPPMAMNCTTHKHTRTQIYQPPIGATQTNMHTQTCTRTKTHTLVVMWVDWSLNKGHGQSQAAQTTSDPEKHPLRNAQSVTVLGQAWPMGSLIHTSTNTLSCSRWLLKGRQTNLALMPW